MLHHEVSVLQDRMLAPKRLATILGCYVLVHASVALFLNWGNLHGALMSLDSQWYEHIARHGYVWNQAIPQPAESVYAFFPSWPLLLWAASWLWPSALPLTYLGTLLSTLMFMATVYLMNQRLPDDPTGLTPRTPLGLWCLVFAPGSWVFASNHTESFFLLVSWGAFASAIREKAGRGVIAASIFAGLAALTRNQGVLVAVCAAFALASRSDNTSMRKRCGVFLLSGLISGMLYAMWPLFQWLQTGNPFMSAAAQKHWHFVSGFLEYLRNFFWLSANNFWRALTFWACLIFGARMSFQKSPARPLGLYVLVSALLWPLQGNNFPQAYRFSAVLFPFWFWLGDGLTAWTARWGKELVSRNFIRVAFLGAAIILSSAYYTRVRWPY